jgi:hypothetical protein
MMFVDLKCMYHLGELVAEGTMIVFGEEHLSRKPVDLGAVPELLTKSRCPHMIYCAPLTIILDTIARFVVAEVFFEHKRIYYIRPHVQCEEPP